MDNFYQAKKGWNLITIGTSEWKAAQAEAMYYSYGVDWDYEHYPYNPPPIGFHGAKKSGCGCGAGKWIMYQSKLGQFEKIEHRWDKLNNSNYGDPDRFYK